MARWIGAAPRQRGSSEAWMFRQPRRGSSSTQARQDQAVGGDDHHVGRARRAAPARAAAASSGNLPSSRRLRGCATGRPCSQRELLDRRGLQLHAAAGRAVGLGQHQRHLEAGAHAGAAARRAANSGVPAKATRIGGVGAQARCSSRVFFSILVLMRSRLSGLRYSTNTLPSRWSISCCTHTASRPSASNSQRLAVAVERAHGHAGVALHLVVDLPAPTGSLRRRTPSRRCAR